MDKEQFIIYVMTNNGLINHLIKKYNKYIIEWDLSNALDCLKQIMHIDNKYSEAQFKYGLICENYLDNYQKAISWYSVAYAYGHKDAEAQIIYVIKYKLMI